MPFYLDRRGRSELARQRARPFPSRRRCGRSRAALRRIGGCRSLVSHPVAPAIGLAKDVVDHCGSRPVLDFRKAGQELEHALGRIVRVLELRDELTVELVRSPLQGLLQDRKTLAVRWQLRPAAAAQVCRRIRRSHGAEAGIDPTAVLIPRLDDAAAVLLRHGIPPWVKARISTWTASTEKTLP